MTPKAQQALKPSEDIAFVQADILPTAAQAIENPMPDVVGLRIPRKRVLATLNVKVNVRELSHRCPHVVFQPEAEEEVAAG